MEYEPGSYLKVQVKQFPARSIRETAEGKYWQQFKAPVLAKQVCVVPPPERRVWVYGVPCSISVRSATRVCHTGSYGTLTDFLVFLCFCCSVVL